MIYSFLLGHQPEISAAEIKAVLCLPKHLNTKTLKHNKATYLILQTKESLDAQKLINALGGTIKIAICHSERDEESPSLMNKLLDYLTTNQPTGKIEFSIADAKIGLQVKKELKALGRSARYIEPKNTATILHNNMVEKKTDLTIIDNKISVTVAIQPIEEFSKRDYGRPRSDEKSGMLPPKLAKIMINLAQIDKNMVILDPFCGSGTILTEAMAMGYTNLIGNDISPKAVENTRQNIDWLISNYHLSHISYYLYCSDAIKLSSQIKSGSVDAVITEPYLGKPLHGNESKQYLQKQAQELSHLYVNSFKSFYKILKPAGIVVFIIPMFKFKNDWLNIDIKNDVEKIGFKIVPFTVETHCNASLQYHRPQQCLAREIWRFRKN